MKKYATQKGFGFYDYPTASYFPFFIGLMRMEMIEITALADYRKINLCEFPNLRETREKHEKEEGTK